tara:strand:- start:3943 stop:5442 length:1500 start_codon:yes stop_codon:yes gene_type:complete
MKPLHLILLLVFNSSLWATNYTLSGSGNYTSGTWSPSYPGTTIGSSDQITITGTITLDDDIEIEGTLIINSGASLTGSKEIKEVKSGGTLTNNGTISIKKIDKIKGTAVLNGSTTVTDDLKVEDNGNLTIGSGSSFSGKKIEIKDDGVLTINGELTLSDELKIKDDGQVTANSGAVTSVKEVKVEDDGILTNSGTFTATENVEVKDDASLTNALGADFTVRNDLKVKDDANFSNVGTFNVEDDIEFEDDAVISITGVLNLCDDDGTEGDNDFDVDSDVTLSGSGTLCMCNANNDNNYNNGSTSQGSITYNTNCNGPLPIEIGIFEASRIGSYIHLYWTTLSEINNARFEIERSYNGEYFEYIGSIKGAGNSNELIEYGFKDFQPNENIDLYYRLKNIDFDGKKDFSDIVHIPARKHSIDIGGRFKVYPTLTSREQPLTFELEGDDLQRLQIVTLSGQVVWEYENPEQNQIVLPHSISTGLHFIIAIGKSSKYSQKIMVR